MASALKSIRWSELDAPAKAEQFQRRGVERIARVDSNSACKLCEKPIALGESYLDVNGTRYAHKSCVISNSDRVWPAPRKLITNKMKEEAAQRKSVPASAGMAPKRGRKPKLLSKNETSTDSNSNSASETKLPKKRGRKSKSEQATLVDTVAKNNSSRTTKKAKVAREPVRASKMQAISKPGRKVGAQTKNIDGTKLRKEMMSKLDTPPIFAVSTKLAASEPKKRGRKPKSESLPIGVNQTNTDVSGAVVTLTITGSLEAIQDALKKLATGYSANH